MGAVNQPNRPIRVTVWGENFHETSERDQAEMAERYRQTISLRRMTPPEDIAATVAFLLSDAARNISGQSLAVDGNVETL